MRFHYFVGRLLSPFHAVFFVAYNQVFRTPRSRVLVLSEDGDLLLVRNWAGTQQWGLPGGGVEKSERPVVAAKRELYEELGVKIPVESLQHVATIHHGYEAGIYAVTVLKNAIPPVPHNPWEITDIKWFSPDDLPTDLSPLVTLALKNLSKTD